MAILLVCIISCVGHFNFCGAFFFLHLVNPVIFLAYYMVFMDDSKKTKKMLLTPAPVMLCLIFDYTIGRLKGRFVYGLFEVNEIGLADIFLIACSAYIFSLIIAGITQYINQKIRR